MTTTPNLNRALGVTPKKPIDWSAVPTRPPSFAELHTAWRRANTLRLDLEHQLAFELADHLPTELLVTACDISEQLDNGVYLRRPVTKAAA